MSYGLFDFIFISGCFIFDDGEDATSVIDGFTIKNGLSATNVGGIPEVIALAKGKLDKNEELVFDKFVKLVEPNPVLINKGIRNLTNNYINIEDFIKIIPKIRSQFDWGKRMTDLTSLLNEI